MADLEPFKDQDIPLVDFPSADQARFGSDILRAVKEFQVGAGTYVFRADESGIWLGAETFDAAPFSVSMHGLMTLQQSIGSKTFTAQPVPPYNVGDMWAGGSSADLKVCLVQRLTGSFVSGDWVLASNYVGSGQVTTIIGNTVTTGFVNALGIVAGSVAAENITGTTITGKTLRTSAGATRVEINGANNALYYYLSGNIVAGFSASGIFFNRPDGVSSATMEGVGTNEMMLTLASGGVGYHFNSSYLYTDVTTDLGTYFDPFGTVYAGGFNLNGTLITNWSQITPDLSAYARLSSASFSGAISASNLYGTNTGDSSGHSGLAQLTGATFSGSITANNGVYVPSTASITCRGYLFLDGASSVYLYDNGSHIILQGHGSTLTLSTNKTAIVPTSKGFNALYCTESPEVWFMDFTKKDKKLDPLFKEVTLSPYHFIKCEDGSYQVWGKRKGHEHLRFEEKTEKEFKANERFLSMNKVV